MLVVSRLALLPLLAVVSASLATAQRIETLLSTGDLVPAAGPIAFIDSYAIGEDGVWAASVLANGVGVILRENGEYIRSQDPLPSPQGGLFAYAINLQMTDGGTPVYTHTSTGAFGTELFRGMNFVFAKGSPIGLAPFSSGDLWDVVLPVAAGGDDWVLAYGRSEPGLENVLVKLRLNAAGSLLAQSMVAWTGSPSFPFGGTPTPLHSIDLGLRSTAVDMNRSGDVIWQGRYDAGATSAVFLGSTPILVEGAPSSLPGRSWEFEPDVTSTALNDNGDWAASLRVSNPSQRVLVSNGLVYVLPGDTISAYDPRVLAGLGGATAGSMVGGITPDGTPVWVGAFFTPEVGSEADLFLGRESVFSTADLTPEGFEISVILQVEVGADGRYAIAAIQSGVSVGAITRLLRVELPLGERYGQPTANSTGEPSELTAYGSARVADNDIELEVRSLPPGSFGYGLASPSRGAVPMVGGSQGTLLLSSTIQRLPTIVQADAHGLAVSPIDLNMPLIGGQSFAAGTTWHFQYWHRDANPSPTSNLSNGVTVSLR